MDDLSIIANDLRPWLRWVPVGLVLWFIVAAAVRASRRRLAEWQALPTVEAYAAQYPERVGRVGVCCFRCGSNHLRDYGQRSAQDTRRIHICRHCKTWLYRTGWG